MRLPVTDSVPLKLLVIQVLLGVCARISHASLPGSLPTANGQKQGRRLAPCQACRQLVNSFHLVGGHMDIF